jgi:hypothetical protein
MNFNVGIENAVSPIYYGGSGLDLLGNLCH